MKKTHAIIWTFAVLFLMIASAYAKELELKVANNNQQASAGSKVTFTVNIKNNQDFAEEVSILYSGELTSLASVPKTSLSLPAHESGQITVAISIPARFPTATYRLRVDALSNDKLKWDNDWINVNVIGTSNTISQTTGLTLVPVGKVASYLGDGTMRLNSYFSPKIVSGDYILKNGDEICVGSSFKMQQNSFAGDWWSDGGPRDSPPVTWVLDLDEAILQMSQGKFNAPTYACYTCSWLAVQEAYKAEQCTVDGTMVCSSNCETETDGIEQGKTENEFSVTDEGDIAVDISCPIECVFFVKNCPGYGIEGCPKGYMVTDLNSQSFSVSLSLKAVKTEIKPSLEITNSKISKIDGDYLIHAIVKNSGNGTAKIDKISLNLLDYEVMYAPKSLESGEESELIFKVDKIALENSKELRVTLKYRADKLGCLTNKEFTEVISLGGFAEFPLTDSVQVYGMAVYGDCENEYFACSSPNKEDKFYAGYACNNKDPYFVPAKERINLKFDISSLPENAEILSAKLILHASEVTREQNLKIFSVGDDWSSKTCEPGGDICTQPYCKECSSLFELGGSLISTTSVSKSGDYSFDVKDVITGKQKTSAKEISFQIQGDESVWESMQKDSCTKQKDWDRYDAKFSGVSGDKPYLKVIYA